MTNPCKLAIEFLRDELEFREMATKSRMGASFQPGYAEKTESIKQAIALLDQSAPPTPGEEEQLSAFQTIVDFIYGFSEGANNPKTDKALCVIKAALAPPQPAKASMEILKHPDGWWLTVTAPSGKKAIFNLGSIHRSAGVITDVLEEVLVEKGFEPDGGEKQT
jgi:hypothetical protein